MRQLGLFIILNTYINFLGNDFNCTFEILARRFWKFRCNHMLMWVVVIHQLSQLRTMATMAHAHTHNSILNGILEIRWRQTNEWKHIKWCKEKSMNEITLWKMAWTILCNLLCFAFLNSKKKKMDKAAEEWENWKRISVNWEKCEWKCKQHLQSETSSEKLWFNLLSKVYAANKILSTRSSLTRLLLVTYFCSFTIFNDFIMNFKPCSLLTNLL